MHRILTTHWGILISYDLAPAEEAQRQRINQIAIEIDKKIIREMFNPIKTIGIS